MPALCFVQVVICVEEIFRPKILSVTRPREVIGASASHSASTSRGQAKDPDAQRCCGGGAAKSSHDDDEIFENNKRNVRRAGRRKV